MVDRESDCMLAETRTQCQATIGPQAKRHLNGVSLAGRWWPAFTTIWTYRCFVYIPNSYLLCCGAPVLTISRCMFLVSMFVWLIFPLAYFISFLIGYLLTAPLVSSVYHLRWLYYVLLCHTSSRLHLFTTARVIDFIGVSPVTYILTGVFTIIILHLYRHDHPRWLWFLSLYQRFWTLIWIQTVCHSEIIFEMLILKKKSADDKNM